MKIRTLIIIAIMFTFMMGYMIGASMDPIDRALREAQKLNRTNLTGIDSLREGGAFNLFGLFSKKQTTAQKIQHDSNFSNQYVSRISNTIQQKENAVQLLEETQAFIDLAKQEVFIDKSLQRYLVSLGRIQLENGLIFQSVTNLQQAYQIQPQDLSAIQLLSIAYLSLYQLLPEGSDKAQAGENAIIFLKHKLKNTPNDINTLYGLALIYTEQGLYANALPLFLQILENNPEHIDSLLGVARIYYDQGQLNQSRRIYEQTEALILELKNQRSFLRKELNINILDQKLITIRNNLEILYSSQNKIGTP